MRKIFRRTLRAGVGRSRGRRWALVSALTLVIGACFTTPAMADPAPVPCSASGGVYYCDFYPAGNGFSGGAPVENSGGGTVGYLNEGSNYVYCQEVGGEISSGGYSNDWWAWTEADDGDYGWVSALWGSGGDDNGAFEGVPGCGGAHGTPPGGGNGGSGGTCGSTPGAGNAVTQWNNVVACVLGMLGQPANSTLINDVDIVINGESSGDPNAINEWDINAQEGHPSIGLVQVIQPTFNTYHSSRLADDIWDPAANIYAGMNYAIHTYGSIQNIPGVVSVNGGGGYVGYVVKSHTIR
jgi:Transglycosylase SLT domain